MKNLSSPEFQEQHGVGRVFTRNMALCTREKQKSRYEKLTNHNEENPTAFCNLESPIRPVLQIIVIVWSTTAADINFNTNRTALSCSDAPTQKIVQIPHHLRE